MNFKTKEQLGFISIAMFNGIFIYPKLKSAYKQLYSNNAVATHYAFFDIEVDGKDVGRLDFELFGHEAPKTVNNFLGLCTGDYNPIYRYKGTYFLANYPQRFILGGDIAKGDGSGSCTVYMEDGDNQALMDAEKN